MSVVRGGHCERKWLPSSVIGTDRIPPRECIAAARKALDQGYNYDTPPYPLLIEALDWLRRGLEQMAEADYVQPVKLPAYEEES